jgi:hypothetical protein
VKKLLTFLIMLAAGVALTAVPVTGEPGAISAMNTAEAAPQRAGVFAAVTDVPPAIALSENYTGMRVLAENTRTRTDGALKTIGAYVLKIAPADAYTGFVRKELKPYYGRSKTAIGRGA